jgi:hypothetical protein
MNLVAWTGSAFSKWRSIIVVVAALLPSLAPAKETPWIVVRGEFFDLYTNNRESTAIDSAVWLEQFRRTVTDLWGIETRAVRRAIVVQFRTERDFEPYRDARYKGGFFIHDGVSAVMALGAASEADWRRKMIQHEATHWLMAVLRDRPPLWVREGMAELYATFELSNSESVLFRDDVNNARWLEACGIEGLRNVVTAQYQHLDYNDKDAVCRFYAQSWLMMHYLFCGVGVKGGRAQLLRYLEIVEQRGNLDEAFKEAFGCDVAAMENRLRDYLHGGTYRFKRFRFGRDDMEKQFKAQPAPPAEVETALALVHAYGRGDPDGARTRLRAARDAFPDHPAPREALAGLALTKGDYRDASDLFKEAAERGSVHPLAYYLPATLELSDRLGGSPRDFSLRPVDARRLSDAMIKGIELGPTLDQAPGELGLALLFTDPPRVEDLAFLARLVKRADQPEEVKYRAAGLMVRLGERVEAKKLLDHLAATTSNPLLAAAVAQDLGALDNPKPEIRIGSRRIIALPDGGPRLPRMRIVPPRR